MRADLSTGKAAKRHPYDWYVELGWEWDQIVAAIGIEDELHDGVTIWDPAAGFGHCGSRMEAHGFAGRILLSDIVNRVAWDDFDTRPDFFSADFLEIEQPLDRPCSIWTNPPYSYKKVWYGGAQMNIGEAFVRHALTLATHRVVVLMPGKWLAAGQKRSKLFRHDYPPETVLHFCQRPSMPPGDCIDLLGSKAYSGGAIDYCALVWDIDYPTPYGETRTIWLPPLGES